uniref:Uncharacterized protein n=1 Tax=Populus alba TaxID=43335 RepID=A0A4V6A809_POPAL|nr:hypothetical protein D5086_0000175890 [Populus alba]
MAKEVLQKHDLTFCNRTIVDAVRALDHHEAGIAWLPVATSWRNLRNVPRTVVSVGDGMWTFAPGCVSTALHLNAFVQYCLSAGNLTRFELRYAREFKEALRLDQWNEQENRTCVIIFPLTPGGSDPQKETTLFLWPTSPFLGLLFDFKLCNRIFFGAGTAYDFQAHTRNGPMARTYFHSPQRLILGSLAKPRAWAEERIVCAGNCLRGIQDINIGVALNLARQLLRKLLRLQTQAASFLTPISQKQEQDAEKWLPRVPKKIDTGTGPTS